METNPVKKLLQLRLIAATDSLRQETKRYAGNNNLKIAEAIQTALDDAEYFAELAQFQMGWNKIFLAEQQMILLMNEDQRAIKADYLRIEAGKLTGWRKDQIYHLLGRPDAEPRSLRIWDKDKIIEAMKIRNDFYNTRNHRMLLRRANLDTVTVALLLILGAVLLLSFCAPVSGSAGFGPLTIIYSMLFGALGASFSMAYTISTTDIELAIPDQLQGIYNIIIRLGIGATAACVVSMLFLSGILKGTFSEHLHRPETYFYLVLAFASGFSERWVLNLLNGLTRSEGKGSAEAR